MYDWFSIFFANPGRYTWEGWRLSCVNERHTSGSWDAADIAQAVGTGATCAGHAAVKQKRRNQSLSGVYTLSDWESLPVGIDCTLELDMTDVPEPRDSRQPVFEPFNDWPRVVQLCPLTASLFQQSHAAHTESFSLRHSPRHHAPVARYRQSIVERYSHRVGIAHQPGSRQQVIGHTRLERLDYQALLAEMAEGAKTRVKGGIFYRYHLTGLIFQLSAAPLEAVCLSNQSACQR